MIIFDNHMHLRRDGRYLEAVKEFHNAGGTHFVLCQYPMPSLALQKKSYNSVYQITLDMAKEISKAIEVIVFITVGPYPVDYLFFREHISRSETIALMKQGIDEAAALCVENKCIGIGEIGRPHFPVSPEVFSDSNDILLYGMQRARDVHVPVVLHTESTTPEQCKELVAMGKKAGLVAEKIVKHFSPAFITSEENYGVMPSVLASKKNVTEALQKGSRFLLETDYIDDPRRPGAVLGPKTVPRITKNLLDAGNMQHDDAYQIHVHNPQKTYNIQLE